jgi:hypothetical protein
MALYFMSVIVMFAHMLCVIILHVVIMNILILCQYAQCCYAVCLCWVCFVYYEFHNSKCCYVELHSISFYWVCLYWVLQMPRMQSVLTLSHYYGLYILRVSLDMWVFLSFIILRVVILNIFKLCQYVQCCYAVCLCWMPFLYL